MGTFSIGQLVGGRYRLAAPLARGGMGAVYRAIDERVGRPVALKVLLSDFGTDPLGVARFEREATAIASLQHPGIVQVLDLGREDDAPYLVMELVVGQTLSAVLTEHGKVDASRAADIAEQALFAIAAAHGAGIVHRDLKPGNLMVVPTGGREAVKVLDFGLAQLKAGPAYARLTRTGVILGTPAFMSPEQARGEPCDARTDVYAMGVVLYALLTGQKAAAGRDMPEILANVLARVPERADRVEPSVPVALAALCEVALQKRASDRFETAIAFATALVELRSGSSASGPPQRPIMATPSVAQDIPITQAPATSMSLAPVAAPSAPSTRAPPAAPVLQSAYAPLATPLVVSVLQQPPPGPAPSPPAATGWSTRTVILGALALAGSMTLLTCIGAAVAFRVWTTIVSTPGGYVAPAAGPPDSICERALRCCEVMGGDRAGCGGLRVYATQGAAGDAMCRDLLASYVATARAEGRACE